MEHSVDISLDICAKFGIDNLPQSPGIKQNSNGGISDIWISGQSFIRENCYNSRISNDIDIKRGPVTKLDQRNTATSKFIARMFSCYFPIPKKNTPEALNGSFHKRNTATSKFIAGVLLCYFPVPKKNTHEGVNGSLHSGMGKK